MPSHRTSHRTTGTLALGLLLATTLGLGGTAGAAPQYLRDPRTDPRTSTGSTAAARQVLHDARAALSGEPGGPDRDATLALRDLFRLRPALTGADRQAADRILARPTDPGDEDYLGVADEVSCGISVCVHWTEDPGTGEAVSPTDTTPANGLPDYVDSVLATMDSVHGIYVDAGYRAPLPDDGFGGNDMPDVYLANIGDQALYGYCTSDDPAPSYAVWAYCVLDNDYSPDEFGSVNTPTENMQVTAAHEYFHAVQFGYDAAEDGWFMEATATWVEDELFDDVDDNVSYLAAGPLGHPETPLDRFGGSHHYGDWIFFRYLTERFTDERGGLPSLVLDFWERADSTQGAANDYYSLQAIRSVLAGRGATLRAAFSAFAAANNDPTGTYEEGAANGYPLPPYAFPVARLSPSQRSTGWRSVTLDHLASGTGAFLPSSSMGPGWKLRVKLDMAPRKRGSTAVVTSYRNGGTPTSRFVSLDRDGDGSLTVPFTSAGVSRVEVTLVNASDRFSSCWVDSPFSCAGAPRDDDLRQRMNVTAVN